MLSALFATVSTTFLAVVCALLLGSGLGRLSHELRSFRLLVARLVELRGALPTLIAAPLLDGWLHLPATITLGALVGTYQGISVARWIQSLKTRSAISHRQAPAASSPWIATWSPAVLTTMALSSVHIVTLEALLSLCELPPFTVSLGSWMAQAMSPAARFGAVLALSALFLVLDRGAERLRLAPAARAADAP